ncbi:ribose-phosphate pyrophosphokinase [archaeon]|nr:ribose-phosphate pyrophosphokinase [archaeon]NCP79204.1 ribose-phosphate pyrophosphokinase [archaeon]NCP97849.1 ribose-phosphate pyrophosphokinase [archaeon]NCQ06971.1 ribose-phosphate pyrophosphokinase [archaeon]NCQ50767.1 ribose-phosphate pyrophosphokinase [archaeon]
MEDEYIIISTNKEKAQATTIANKLNLTLGDINIKQVQGSETSVDVKSYVNYKKVFLIYNISQPVNESIMQLLFIADAIRKEGAEKIYLITSYLPYTKIKYRTEYKLNFSLFSRLLQETNIDKIYTFGLYSPKISFYLKIPLYNVPLINLFSKVIEDNFTKNKNLIITTIDYEMQETSKDIAKKTKSEVIFPTKDIINNKIKFNISGNVNGKDILIISDSIFTGENIIEYSNYLTLKGAKNISVIATHGILDKKAIPLIEKSVIKQIYVINHNYQKSEKIKIVSTTKIIEEIIKRTVDKKNLKNVLK